VSSRGATTLEEAQETKLELVCAKLGLRPGERLLDVGCGWGSFALHAAREHGVHVTGITLSEPQAALARTRASDAGLGDRIDIRVADYRELRDEPFDAIASIGMVEHVGNAMIDAYAARLAELLRPGGRLLNHGIARLRHGDPEAGPFSERYVFPDAAPLHLSRILAALESAGLVTEHVEGFAADYARTLLEWLRRVEAREDEALALVGPERLRVWRVYLRAARRGFELLAATSLLTAVLPEVARMQGIEQSPDYHPEGDVFRHTLLAIEQLPAGVSETLALGLLLHDVGKPVTASRRGDRITFYGHATAGANMAVAICQRLRRSRATWERVAYLVTNHLRLVDAPEMRLSTLKRLLRHEGFDELLALARMDALASNRDLRYVEFCAQRRAELAREEIRPPRLLGGDDLIDLGYQPGPRLGEILRALEEAQLEGEVTSRVEAERFVRSRFPP